MGDRLEYIDSVPLRIIYKVYRNVNKNEYVVSSSKRAKSDNEHIATDTVKLVLKYLQRLNKQRVSMDDVEDSLKNEIRKQTRLYGRRLHFHIQGALVVLCAKKEAEVDTSVRPFQYSKRLK